MKAHTLSKVARWTLVSIGLVFLSTVPAVSQAAVEQPLEPIPDRIEDALEETIEPEGRATLKYSDDPTLRPEESKRLYEEFKRRLARVNLSVPVPVSGDPIEPAVGPPSGYGDRITTAPVQFVNRDNIAGLPASDSHVAEMAAANNGKYTFATWNWGAARSTNNGVTWSYVNPYTTNGFSDFCCDQDVIHDKGRDVFFWLRQGVPDASGNNRYMLGASTDDGVSFCNYIVNSPTGMWYDYPRLTLTNNRLWITWNLFNSADVWQFTRIQSWPISDMVACVSATVSFLDVNDLFNLTGANGGTSKAYFAGHINTSNMRIYSWQEGSGTVLSFNRGVPTWTSGSMSCASANGGDACARGDHRVTGGYVKRHAALAFSPLEIVGFFWNAKENGTQPLPYVENAWFYTNTMNYGGRALIWNSTNAILYADSYPDVRGNVGIVANFSDPGSSGPLVCLAKDDYTDGQPPGWSFTCPFASSVGPTDDNWGDYNRVRQFGPLGTCWLATGHYLDAGGNTHPVFMVFGNGRDFEGCDQNWKQQP